MNCTNVKKLYRHIAAIHEFRKLTVERKEFMAEAKKEFEKTNLPGGDLNDYMRAMRKHRVTFSEYMYRYEYWKLTEKERDEFISCAEMQAVYRKTVDPSIRNTFYH